MHFLKDKNIWLNINKPVGISSAKVVAIIKRITKAKKVGHGGTLDPFANGVLPVALNKSTKTSQEMMDGLKEYIFYIKWGKSTDTDDCEGEVIKISNKRPSTNELSLVLFDFIGDVEQKPSKFSAIKINGKRAYELARKKIEFDIPSRIIKISKITLISNSDDGALLKVECSKGTYIRTLSNDICKKLQVCGHVNSLTRTKVGKLNIDSTISLDLLKYDITNIISQSEF